MVFNVKLTKEDMYRFNMYHSYTSFTGIGSIVIAVFIIIVACITVGKVDTIDTILYILLGLVFLCYMPLSLKLRSNRQLLASEILSSTLTYTLEEDGIKVATSVSEETAKLIWENIYKVVETKRQVLIYTNRVSAYILPKEAIDDLPAVKSFLKDKIKDYKLHLK